MPITDEIETATEEAQTPEIDVAAAAASIAQKSFGEEKPEPVAAETPTEQPQEEATPEEVAEALAAPKTWAKETHDLWKTLPRAAQEQVMRREEQMHTGIEQYRAHHELGKSLHEVITPYMPMIQANGLEPAKAVASLLNAHYRLTNGSPEQRMAAYERLGIDLGLKQAQAAANIDPAMQKALERLERLESELATGKQAQIAQAKEKIAAEVNTFANEKDAAGKPLRPYFDEVSDDIVAFISQGASLKDAYDKAVWANPVTREKQRQADIKAAAQEAREKNTREANAARQASRTNVNGRDTSGTPTEAQGTIKDTLAKTFDKIAARSSH